MTETEWLGCTDPIPMLEFLRGKVSDRKLRLFAVACCRKIWPLLADGRSCNAVEVAERFVDGFSTRHDLAAANQTANQPCYDAINRADGWDDHAMAAIAAQKAADDSPDFALSVISHAAILGDHHDTARQTVRYTEQCCLLRDILGNPFRPPPVSPFWQTTTVKAVAEAIYNERAFDRLPILADALEDAGCQDADILGHCRQPGEHARGCWVVDLLLGRN